MALQLLENHNLHDNALFAELKEELHNYYNDL
jgi:hypothetical protein